MGVQILRYTMLNYGSQILQKRWLYIHPKVFSSEVIIPILFPFLTFDL